MSIHQRPPPGLNLLGSYLNLSTQPIHPCLEAAGPLTPRKSPWPAETIGWQCQALGQRSEATGLHACREENDEQVGFAKGQVGKKHNQSSCSILSWTIFHVFVFGLLFSCCSKVKGPISSIFGTQSLGTGPACTRHQEDGSALRIFHSWQQLPLCHFGL